LAIEISDSLSNIASCKLLHDLLERRIFLPNDFVKPRRPQTGILQLSIGPSRFDSFMLARVPNEEYPVMVIQALDKRTQLLRTGHARFVDDVNALLSILRLFTSGKVTLQSLGLHTCFAQLLSRTRCRRESLDPVSSRFGGLTNSRQRCCFPGPGDSLQCHHLVAIGQYRLDCAALANAQMRMMFHRLLAHGAIHKHFTVSLSQLHSVDHFSFIPLHLCCCKSPPRITHSMRNFDQLMSAGAKLGHSAPRERRSAAE
jgi:hypothetical protein